MIKDYIETQIHLIRAESLLILEAAVNDYLRGRTTNATIDIRYSELESHGYPVWHAVITTHERKEAEM